MAGLRSASYADPRDSRADRLDRREAKLLEAVAAPPDSSLPLPRLLLVLAHPDDEVLAVGGRLERLANSRIMTVTDGVPRDGVDARNHGFSSLQAYRSARAAELADSLHHAGLRVEDVLAPPEDSKPMPVPDQCASLHLVSLARTIADLITAFRPEAVLTHPYEGGHPDHDACAFAVQAALRIGAERLTGGPSPVRIEAPFYHAGQDGSIQTGCFLDALSAPLTLTRELSAVQAANKIARLACFRSQVETLAQFDTRVEQFRVAPRYDFSRPPHPGQLLYERFSWGMSGERFRELAAAAGEELFGVQRSQPEAAAAHPRAHCGGQA